MRSAGSRCASFPACGEHLPWGRGASITLASRHSSRECPLSNIDWKSATQFSEAKPRPIEWVVDEIIPTNTVTLINSVSGAGKSILAAHLAICVLTGKSWLGLPTRQGRVGYWDQDNPDSVLTDNRICALARGLGVDLTQHEGAFIFRATGPVLLNQMERNLLIAELKARRITLLIVDTLASVNPLEEGDGFHRVMTDGLFPFVYSGITPVVLHHIGKDRIDNKGQKHRRTGIDAARGHSSLVASSGAAYNLLMYGEERYLECAKPRYGKIQPITIDYDEDGALGLPDWTIRVNSTRVKVSQENLTHMIRENNWQSLSSRKLVKILADRGFSTSQKTASRALSESK